MKWTAPAEPFLTLISPDGESPTTALLARVSPGTIGAEGLLARVSRWREG